MNECRNAKAKPVRPPAEAAANLQFLVSSMPIVSPQHPASSAETGWQLGEFRSGPITASYAFRRGMLRLMSGPYDDQAARSAAWL